VFFYLDDRERTLDSPTDKIMLSLTTFADEMEREKARQRTTDAMMRKAIGRPTSPGARASAYTNVEVAGADGRRTHVERRVHDAEATVVRQIFALCAEGFGMKSIRAPNQRRRRVLSASAAGTPQRLVTFERARGAVPRHLPRPGGLEPLEEARPVGAAQSAPPSGGRVDSAANPRSCASSPRNMWEAAAPAACRVPGRCTCAARAASCGARLRAGTESKYLLVGLARCGVCVQRALGAVTEERSRQEFLLRVHGLPPARPQGVLQRLRGADG
jgi:hypothetical protein